MPSSFLRHGTASYALYLFDSLIAPAIPAVLAKLDMRIPMLSIALCVVVAIVVTYGIYRWIERPIAKYLARDVWSAPPSIYDRTIGADRFQEPGCPDCSGRFCFSVVPVFEVAFTGYGNRIMPNLLVTATGIG